jgi:uncharacterized protein
LTASGDLTASADWEPDRLPVPASDLPGRLGAMNRAVPFRQFVLKVHSRCDLACDHCYVYEHADQSWRGRPRELAAATAAQAGRRIAEHARAHGLARVGVVVHGGEPLLLGAERMRETLAALCREAAPATRLDLRVHTNGVRLDEAFLDLFAEYGVRVGVSLDGGRAANDRHRLYRDGRSSYDQVLGALVRLRGPRHRHLYSGLLCTVDLANDPVEVYRGLLAQEPPRIDLLLPHATWEHQPPGLGTPRDPDRPMDGAGEYARWFAAVFDAWDADGRPVPIRTFESVLAAYAGRPVGTEALGLDPVDLLVIETDGALEQVDSLKTAYDGAAATGLDVWRHSLDEAAAVPGIAVRQLGLDGVSAVCRECELVRICGGGLYPHRYRPGHGFANPSVYCADLKHLITHVISAEERRGRGRAGARARVRAAERADDARAEDGRLDLTAAEFDGLAAGFGSAEAVRVLARNQAEIGRTLLALLAHEGPQHDRRFAESWDLLVAASAQSPAGVARLFAHPYLRAWAVPLVRHLRDGDASEADLHHLEALAASAAVHAGLDVRVPLPVRDGVAPLPTFGSITGGTDRIWLHAATAVQQVDQPTHSVDAAGLRLAIEDTDPYRACHGQIAQRLDPPAVARWSAALSDALGYLDAYLPEFAPTLRAGLTTLVPLRPTADGSLRSSTARDAFGAVGLALPQDPTLLPLLLVHEFQHVKLGALLDMAELYDATDTALYHTRWRTDPRPLEGLLQGTYAHLAVTAFWRVRRTQLTGVARREAEANFARWREATAEALDTLTHSGSLTGLGVRLARSLGETLEPWLAEPVGPGAGTSTGTSTGTGTGTGTGARPRPSGDSSVVRTQPSVH